MQSDYCFIGETLRYRHPLSRTIGGCHGDTIYRDNFGLGNAGVAEPDYGSYDSGAWVLYLVLFLVIVGGALWITPRLAKWLDEREKKNVGYFDGMLTEDPNQKSSVEETTSEEEKKS